MRAAPPLVSARAAGGPSAPEGAPHGANGVARKPETARPNDPDVHKVEGQARRAAGLAALEAGDYDKALINFTEAKALLRDKANVGDLLRVTEELRHTAVSDRVR